MLKTAATASHRARESQCHQPTTAGKTLPISPVLPTCLAATLLWTTASAVAQRPESTPLEEARHLQQQGRMADALTLLRRASDTSPADAAVRNMLGALLNREGDYPEALIHAEAAVAAAPDEYRYRLNRGIVLADRAPATSSLTPGNLPAGG